MTNSYELLRLKDETESYIKTFVSKEISIDVRFSERSQDEFEIIFSSGYAHAADYIKIYSLKEINSKTNSREIFKKVLIRPLLLDLAEEKWLNK